MTSPKEQILEEEKKVTNKELRNVVQEERKSNNPGIKEGKHGPLCHKALK